MSINDEINKIDQRYDTPPPSDETLINTLRLNAATRSDIQIAANWTKIVALIMMWSTGLMLIFLIGAFMIGLTKGNGLGNEIGVVLLGLLVVVGILAAGLFLGKLLLNYSNALKALTEHEKPYGLAPFFQQQNRYWIMVGIYTVGSIAIYIICLVVLVPIINGQSI